MVITALVAAGPEFGPKPEGSRPSVLPLHYPAKEKTREMRAYFEDKRSNYYTQYMQ